MRRPARSFDLHQHLTVLLVCAVATVVFTRGFLAATGYPQVGGSKLHIAHVLWGGLLMLAALVATLAFLSPATRPIAAVVGGIGFGLFIDEVGKFVTKNVNYFFRPAIAIIYVCFIVLFAVIRWLSRWRFSAREATMIGLETLKRGADGSLSDERRDEVLALMSRTHDDSALARGVRELLEQCRAAPEGERPLPQRVSMWLARIWTRLTGHRLFRAGVFTVLAAAAVISLVQVGWLARNGVTHLTFSQRAFAVATLVSDAMLVVGAIRLGTSLLSALHWYDHAVLLDVTVAQVFLFASEQLEATVNLVVLLVVWSLIRWAIHYETAHKVERPKPA